MWGILNSDFNPCEKDVGETLRILVVEDDRQLAEYVRKKLEAEGYEVKVCHDGSAGLRAAELTAYDLIVLDLMLPFISGIEVTKRLRFQKIATPILMLTARDAAEDIEIGLDVGADDYLTKPFSLRVLLARIRARTRSSKSKQSSTLRCGELVLETETHEVRRGGQAIKLTRTEFALLECLMRAAGRVVSRDSLIENVWGERDITDKGLESFMRCLREKVELPGMKRLIHTERGIGYKVKDYLE